MTQPGQKQLAIILQQNHLAQAQYAADQPGREKWERLGVKRKRSACMDWRAYERGNMPLGTCDTLRCAGGLAHPGLFGMKRVFDDWFQQGPRHILFLPTYHTSSSDPKKLGCAYWEGLNGWSGTTEQVVNRRITLIIQTIYDIFGARVLVMPRRVDTDTDRLSVWHDGQWIPTQEMHSVPYEMDRLYKYRVDCLKAAAAETIEEHRRFLISTSRPNRPLEHRETGIIYGGRAGFIRPLNNNVVRDDDQENAVASWLIIDDRFGETQLGTAGRVLQHNFSQRLIQPDDGACVLCLQPWNRVENTELSAALRNKAIVAARSMRQLAMEMLQEIPPYYFQQIGFYAAIIREDYCMEVLD